MCEMFEYSQLLDAALLANNPEDQIALVAAFSIGLPPTLTVFFPETFFDICFTESGPRIRFSDKKQEKYSVEKTKLFYYYQNSIF
jgi:hypothetical protein